MEDCTHMCAGHFAAGLALRGRAAMSHWPHSSRPPSCWIFFGLGLRYYVLMPPLGMIGHILW